MNRFYDKAVIAAQTARPMNLLSGNIKAVLIDLGAYTPDFSNDEFLAAIPSGARYGVPVSLTTKTVTGRVFNADPVSFQGLTGLPTIEAIVIFEDTGNPTTSPLLAFIDTATGLPTVAAATQVDITWSTSSTKIFKL